MTSESFHTSSPEETQDLGRKLGQSLPPHSVVCLWGDLGAGKTTLAKGIVSGASSVSIDEVTSPTFTYLNVYPGDPGVFHFDLYRLHDADEFLSMGFDEYFDAGGISCVEWPERIQEVLPEKRIDITLSAQGESERLVTVQHRTCTNGSD